VVDPNDSDVNQKYRTDVNDIRLGKRLTKIENILAQPFSTIRKPFASQTDKARMIELDKASDWFGSDNAREYFKRNPEMLAVAEKNPFEFVKKLRVASRQGYEAERTKRAGVATPTATAAGAAPGGQTAVRSKILPNGFAVDYRDVTYDLAEQKAAQKVGIPVELLRAVRLAGEKTNADRVSSAGARTPYQFTPETRKLFINKYKVDPWSTPINAATAAAYHLKESLDKGLSTEDALREYHGGPNRNKWGKVNDAYAARTMAFLGEKATSSGAAAGARQAGVLEGSATQEPVLNLTKLNTYMAQPDRIPPAMSNTIRQRDLIAQEARIYANSGNEGAYQQSLARLQELDANLARLQGAQAIIDIQTFNDPRRAESLLSYLSNGQLQVRMRQDGTFAFFGRNQRGDIVPIPGQDNVSRSQFLRTLRDASDEKYRAQREASEAAFAEAQMKFQQQVDLKVLEGRIEGEIEQFKGDVDLSKARIQAEAALEAAKLRGRNVASLTVGEENWITFDNPDNPGEQMVARPTEITLPSGQVEYTLDARPLSTWVGGAK
jgi:hypothetical protein